MISAAARIRLIQGLFFVSGFCGLIYESIWSHYLKLFLGHAAYAQSVVLVVFILRILSTRLQRVHGSLDLHDLRELHD